MKNPKTRWKLAQSSEKSWWEKQISTLDLRYFKRFADGLLQETQGIISIDDKTRILEIGSGPAGILTHLTSEHRFAFDPLEHVYGRMAKCKEERDPKVKYLSA